MIEALGELGDEDVRGRRSCGCSTRRRADRSRSPMRLPGLYERYESRYGAGEHIADLVRRNITATGTQNILDAVQRVGADRLPGLARVLGWLDGRGGAARADAPARAATRCASQVVEALVRNGAGVVDLLIEQLRRRGSRHAAGGRGRARPHRRSPGDARRSSRRSTIRELAVAAAGALARIGDGRRSKRCSALLGDPDAAVRQAVDRRAEFDRPSRDMPRRIAALLDDADPIVRESALKIAGYFGYSRVPGPGAGALPRRQRDRCAAPPSSSCRSSRTRASFDALLDALERRDGRRCGPRRRRRSRASSIRRDRRRCSARSTMPIRGSATSRCDRSARWRHATPCRPSLATAANRIRRRTSVWPRSRSIGRLNPPEALDDSRAADASPNEDIARAAIGALGTCRSATRRWPILERALRAPDAAGASGGGRRARPRAARRGVPQTPAVGGGRRSATPTSSTAAVDALARVGMRDRRAGQRSHARADRADGRTGTARSGDRGAEQPAAAPHRRHRRRACGIASPDVRCASVEALEPHEAAGRVARARVGARRCRAGRCG